MKTFAECFGNANSVLKVVLVRSSHERLAGVGHLKKLKERSLA
jgi:hypothetical protein